MTNPDPSPVLTALNRIANAINPPEGTELPAANAWTFLSSINNILQSFENRLFAIEGVVQDVYQVLLDIRDVQVQSDLYVRQRLGPEVGQPSIAGLLDGVQQALTFAGPDESVQLADLFNQLGECLCPDWSAGVIPPPQLATCPIAFASLPGLEAFNFGGIELIGQGVPLTTLGGTDNYHVFVAVPRIVVSSTLQCSIAPVIGPNLTPVGSGPVRFALYAASFQTAGFAFTYCDTESPFNEYDILLNVVGAGFVGDDGNIGGTTERQELYTLIEDDNPVYQEWFNIGVSTLGISNEVSGPGGEPIERPPEAQASGGAVLYIAIRDSLIAGGITAAQIRQNLTVGFYDLTQS